MGMRVRMIIAVFGTLLVSSVIAPAQSPKPSLVALGTPERWTERQYSAIPRSGETQIAFCGQCSDDSHCGTGNKCCGPSSCRECVNNVVTCPRR